METFADLIAEWGSTANFAAALEIPYPTAAAWKQRNSIPTDRWPELKLAAHAKEIELTDSQLLAFRSRGLSERKPEDLKAAS